MKTFFATPQFQYSGKIIPLRVNKRNENKFHSIQFFTLSEKHFPIYNFYERKIIKFICNKKGTKMKEKSCRVLKINFVHFALASSVKNLHFSDDESYASMIPTQRHFQTFQKCVFSLRSGESKCCLEILLSSFVTVQRRFEAWVGRLLPSKIREGFFHREFLQFNNLNRHPRTAIAHSASLFTFFSNVGRKVGKPVGWKLFSSVRRRKIRAARIFFSISAEKLQFHTR